jgi:hypothetical protein
MHSRAMHSVYTESFGPVAPYRLARLGQGVAPDGVERLGQNFLCKPDAFHDLVAPDSLVRLLPQSRWTVWRDLIGPPSVAETQGLTRRSQNKVLTHNKLTQSVF